MAWFHILFKMSWRIHITTKGIKKAGNHGAMVMKINYKPYTVDSEILVLTISI